MRAVLQTVKNCGITADGKEMPGIKSGFLVLLGISAEDTEKEADALCEKILKMRIFPDENGKMNLSLTDGRAGGDLMIVSNFTLYANCKSRRPDFMRAARPEQARRLYEYFINRVKLSAKDLCARDPGARLPDVTTGVFGADMKITFTNDGPVTVILDTDEF